MKTLFLIAALIGAVYLILQTPAGQTWFEDSEPEVNMQQQIQDKISNKIQEAQQASSKAVQSVEYKVTEFAQSLNQQQQTQINQLENRIAELENELVMGRIKQKQQHQQGIQIDEINLQTSEQQSVATPYVQVVTQHPAETAVPEATSENTLQLHRKRQARLQDIAEKMEMSSLQALVN